jgi:hypothetical protein
MHIDNENMDKPHIVVSHPFLSSEILALILSFLRGEDMILCKRTKHLSDELWEHAIRILPETIQFEKPQWVRDSHLSYFQGAKHFQLRNCIQLSDDGLKYVKGATSVDVSYCYRLTDCGMENFQGIQYVNVSWCDKTTNLATTHFTEACKIVVSGCDNLSDDALVNFKKAKIVDISGLIKITDTGLLNMIDKCEMNSTNSTSLREIILYGCGNITVCGIMIFLKYFPRTRFVTTQANKTKNLTPHHSKRKKPMFF